MIIETQGCVTVQDNIINNGFINTYLIQDSQIELNVKDVTPQDSIIERGFICINITDYSQISLNISDINTSPDIKIEDFGNGIDVSCGLVCGPSVGLPVLYASDGVLITINGQYLIVQKEN